ncbi:MAG: ribosomal RNA small subunit methyltransferase A [Lentisphaerae bacterium]|nr:ribosomal RNA small subunit methyltransferase A [Lentisphaerota bacterium]MCP4102855.1 ribosomal RNA small subunit methyltransferase A [Lentisphaerota bacterium]
MNKTELFETLEKFNMRPSKVLGQNFLIDKNLLDFIVREAQPEPGEVVLEAGPGFGALTRLLLAAGADLYAIEFDRRLCDYLRNNIKEPNFHLIESDACRIDIASILPEGKPFRAIANLPYAISSIFVAKLLDLPTPPTQMIFMLQKEMAQRLAAKPGTKNYGALSVRSQQLYNVKLLRTVPPQVFHPRPDVESALVKFEANGYMPDFELRKRLCGIVRCAFAQRRKKILKPLAAAYGREEVEAALAKVGIPDNARPGELGIKKYEELAALL